MRIQIQTKMRSRAVKLKIQVRIDLGAMCEIIFISKFITLSRNDNRFIPSIIECLNNVSISTNNKQSGYELSWSLSDCTSAQTSESYLRYTISCCLSYGAHTLSCNNAGEGNYIEIQGRKYCQESTDGEISVEVEIIGKLKLVIINTSQLVTSSFGYS